MQQQHSSAQGPATRTTNASSYTHSSYEHAKKGGVLAELMLALLVLVVGFWWFDTSSNRTAQPDPPTPNYPVQIPRAHAEHSLAADGGSVALVLDLSDRALPLGRLTVGPMSTLTLSDRDVRRLNGGPPAGQRNQGRSGLDRKPRDVIADPLRVTKPSKGAR